MVEPDPLKIKYRETLIQAVQMVVRGLMLPEPEVITQVATQLVKASDRDAFIKMLKEALRNIHEGSVVRYRIRLSEYLAWRQANSPYSPRS
jgi:hypothetical protein